MKPLRIAILLLIILAGCNQPKDNTEYLAYVGATIIDGNGGEPFRDGILLIQNGKIVSVGTRDRIALPANTTLIDVKGKFIVPGLINGHGHVGDVKGITGGHYSRENIIDNLSLYARYGITTVVSLGGDKQEAEPLRAVNDTTTHPYARLFIAGEVISGDSPAVAVSVANRNHAMGVDIMKIRVDDNLGTTPKMPYEIQKAVIDRSHVLGYKIATHMYYLDDARKLVLAGADMLAHSIRDQPVDTDIIGLMKEKHTSYCPTLTRELSTFVYADTPAFFKDPFFLREYDSTIIEPLTNPQRQKEVQKSKGAITYRQQLPIAMNNLKVLCKEGVPIIFGTDSGVPTRFIGYFEHVEMDMMAEAGLTPMQIIVSATRNPAEYLGLKNLGAIAPGHWADFLVLDADPLEDIGNMHKLSKVFIGGVEVKR